MDSAEVLSTLRKRDIDYLRLTWVDNVNCVRYRVIPTEHFIKLICDSKSESTTDIDVNGSKAQARQDTSKSRANKHGGITITKATFGLVGLNVAEGFGPVGMHLYVPDLSSIRKLAYAPGHAFVTGWFEDQMSAQDHSGALTFASDICARSKVRQIVEKAYSTHGVSFLMGFETEVIFLRSTSPIEPVNDHSWSESPAILAGSSESKALHEIAEALKEAGIVLEMYHSEGAPGQYEFATGPLPPLEACDALVCTREIILNVCAKHGIKATLTPRLFKNTVGSAAHAHISLGSPKYPSTPQVLPGDSEPSLSSLEISFVAGLLEHLSGTTAFTLPTPASYGRVVDGCWSGGSYVAWGWENKETPIRICGVPGSGLANYHIEIKTIDGTASPYLVAAALLAAGMDGVNKQMPLRMKGVGSTMAASLSRSERRELGVMERLPFNIEQARLAMKDDKLFGQVFGEHFITSYLAVNKTLKDVLEKGTEDEKTQRMIMRF